MRTYTGLIFNKITQPKADALTLAEDTVIDHCIFDFRSIPLPEQDEIVSSVNGPKVIIRNSLFLGGIKALLAGNGNHLINDSTTASWDLKNCVIIDSGRRCAEAQDGTVVTMRKCWIHNWGCVFAHVAVSTPTVDLDVKKGDVVSIVYSTVSSHVLLFIYDEGAY